jgi:hypothetical protein
MLRFKKYFESIWIAFSQHHQEDDYSGFIRAQLPFANFVDAERRGGDWRSDAINQILNRLGDKQHILFLEQDFLIKDDRFFEKVLNTEHRFLYFKENERVHPAFAIVDRRDVEETRRDFSAVAPYDHFKLFFDQLPKGVNIESLGVRARDDFYHMNGLSQNYVNFMYDDPIYRPINFLYFNYKSEQLPIEHHQKFHQLEQRILREKGHPGHHSFLDRFFPIS